MANVSVDVYVDLDDFDTDDLVEEICRRMKQQTGKKSLSPKERQEVKECYILLSDAMAIPTPDTIEIKTLDDKIKYEHLVKVFNKYNSSDIERLLPE